MAKSRSLKIWLTLIAVAAIAGGAYYYLQGRSGPKPEFATAKISRSEIIQSVTATGTLQPVTTVEISSQISGLIQEVKVDYNSKVKQGDLLARIDPATYQVRLSSAKAELANTRANYQLVKLNTERTRALRAQDLVSQQELDQAEAQLTQAEAQLQIRQSSVQTTEVDLARCNLYAPIDGLILDRVAEVGKTVAASLNAPRLFTLAADLTQMQIEAAVSEGDIGTVEVGQSVNFTVDAYPNRQFHGQVSQIRNAPINVQSVVSYIAIIQVKNDDLLLKPGMTANVSIIIARKEDTLRIANSALRVRIPEQLLPDTPAAAPEPSKTTQPASRDQIRQLMTEAGAGSNSRRMAPEVRGRLIQLAKERGLELPARLLRNSDDTESNGPVTRTVYKLGGTSAAPEVIPVVIKVGITDGSATEVIAGLEEGDAVITSAYLPASGNGAANPFGGSSQRR
ncbi:MAG: efflux RND transporter periplasmic adaptor subunit [Opitutus sp.]|nr:efflux RND transporter periplasmic adaptor subunit [Opitutus sp.]MCS6245902.1 efflux RND transporter periplasmic adaptor subunit [Opitutus sp.]MCS6272960.1 efflux RND transporter periplasmic adaptor subunit [Opitutus sp.]MCS6276019.1 efflux RND transporter periplasmic adaptor subunit [Opitutus sp.]MCS6301114.1 efflux RND transporter periplasmic adaptor subunit [Opitutus sp.]